MEKSINEETGLEEYQFSAVLKTVSEKTLQNSNKTEYKVVGLDYTPPNADTPQRISGFMYMSNYKKGVEIGTEVVCTAINAEEGVIVIASHLESAGNRASRELFGFDDPNKLAVMQEEDTGEPAVAE